MSARENWADRSSGNGEFALSLAAGLALVLAVAALLLPLVKKPAPPAQIAAPVRLSIAAPAPKPLPPAPKPPPPAAKPPPPAPHPPPPMPKPVIPPPPPRPVPAPRPPPRPAVHHPIVHHAPPPAPRPAVPKPLPPQPVSPPPAPAPPSAGQVNLFRDAVRRAVQQVANQVYPQTAQESGTVEITIDYLDGRVLGVSLARSSGFPLLDAAALRAGRIAHYPPPPPDFAGRVFPWTIAIIFRAAPQSIGAD